MGIEGEIRDDVAVLTVNGALRSRQDTAPFHTYIKRLAGGGITQVVVDFSEVKWFGAAMLGVLIASMETLRQAGGDIRLTGVTAKIESILMVTLLGGIFRTVDTVDEAVESFRRKVVEAQVA